MAQAKLQTFGDGVGARKVIPQSLDYASGRTIARHFRVETGLSFGQWREPLSMAEARRASGVPPQQFLRREGSPA